MHHASRRLRPLFARHASASPGIVATALALALVWAAGPSARHSPPVRAADDAISQAREERRALLERIDAQHAEIARLDEAAQQVVVALASTAEQLNGINADLGEVRAQISEATRELAVTRERHAVLVDDLGEMDWTLGLLVGQAGELEVEIEARRRLLGARLAEAYRLSRTTFWERLLSAESLLDVMSQESALLAFGDRDAELARQIERDQAELEARQREIRHVRYETELLRREAAERALRIEAAKRQLSAAETRLRELEAATEHLLAQQREQHRQLLADRADAAQLLAAQEKAEQELRARIRTLVEEALHAGSVPSEFNGTFRWPLAGTVTQEFGCTGLEWEPTVGDCEHFHQGIDVVAPGSTDKELAVVAAGDGVVVFVGYNPYEDPADDPAWIAIIAHSEALTTWYGHLQARAPEWIRAGVRVSAGDVIGWMGDTGHSSGAHLHWAVELAGEFRNPREFL